MNSSSHDGILILVNIPREKFIAIQTGKPIGSEESATKEGQNPEKGREKGVKDKQQAIYELIKNNGSRGSLNEPLNEPLNTDRIASILGIPYSTTKRIIKDLEEHHKIVRVGSKKTGHWEIVSL